MSGRDQVRLPGGELTLGQRRGELHPVTHGEHVFAGAPGMEVPRSARTTLSLALALCALRRARVRAKRNA